MRKLVMVMLLISAVGLGCGCFTDDLCALGGSFADDPNNPGVTAEFALPTHPQAAIKAVKSVAQPVAVRPGAAAVKRVGTVLPPAESPAATATENPVPIRC